MQLIIKNIIVLVSYNKFTFPKAQRYYTRTLLPLCSVRYCCQRTLLSCHNYILLCASPSRQWSLSTRASTCPMAFRIPLEFGTRFFFFPSRYSVFHLTPWCPFMAFRSNLANPEPVIVENPPPRVHPWQGMARNGDWRYSPRCTSVCFN